MSGQDQLNQIAQDLKPIKSDIAAAEDLLNFLEESGERVGDAKNRLRDIKQRDARWTAALKNRGIKL